MYRMYEHHYYHPILLTQCVAQRLSGFTSLHYLTLTQIKLMLQ